MRFLSLVLMIILVSCGLWGALILGGPGVVKYAVKFYSGNQIILHNVKVTPRLNVSAARVEFNLSEPLPILGVSRGATFSWSLENTLPMIKVSLGPTKFNNNGRFNRGELKLAPLKRFDWSTVSAILRFDDILYGNRIELKSLDLNSELKNFFSIATNSSFLANDVFSKSMDLSVSELGGSLDSLSFKTPFTEQDNTFKLFGENLEENSTNIFVNKFKTAITNNTGFLSFETEAIKLVSPNQKFSIENLTLNTNYSINELELLSPLKVDFENIKISEPSSEIEFAQLIINDVMGNPEMDFSGQINRSNIVVNSKYFATLGLTDFEAKFTMTDTESGESLKGQGDIYFNVMPEFSIVVGMALDLPGVARAELCIINRCELENLKIDYDANVGGSSIKGFVRCAEKNCINKGSRHRVITSDTNLVFANLAKTSIFNPVILATIYSQMLSGKEIASGHELNF